MFVLRFMIYKYNSGTDLVFNLQAFKVKFPKQKLKKFLTLNRYELYSPNQI